MKLKFKLLEKNKLINKFIIKLISKTPLSVRWVKDPEKDVYNKVCKLENRNLISYIKNIFCKDNKYKF